MIISRTPLRISFLGGSTDYPQWYNTHGGAVLATSIDKYCYVMLHNGKSWYTFDLPNKSGLASSSAYTVGLLRVCSELTNRDIASIATIWEQDKTGGMVGSQDQFINRSAHDGVMLYIFRKFQILFKNFCKTLNFRFLIEIFSMKNTFH